MRSAESTRPADKPPGDTQRRATCLTCGDAPAYVCLDDLARERETHRHLYQQTEEDNRFALIKKPRKRGRC